MDGTGFYKWGLRASRLCSEVNATVHAEIEALLGRLSLSRDAKLLDIGCWDGEATVRYAEAAHISLSNTHGVEASERVLARASQLLKVYLVDLERDRLPFESEFFDVVVANQVFEHLKQIYSPMDEIYRVLRRGGHLVFSVPNLASLHNRLLLALGFQPTAIRALGPHVRGFTCRETKAFLEWNGLFKVVDCIGVGFYPFRMRIARPIGKLFRGMSHTPVFQAIKQLDTTSGGWSEEAQKHVQTYF